jgi:hypothetical protein
MAMESKVLEDKRRRRKYVNCDCVYVPPKEAHIYGGRLVHTYPQN